MMGEVGLKNLYFFIFCSLPQCLCLNRVNLSIQNPRTYGGTDSQFSYPEEKCDTERKQFNGKEKHDKGKIWSRGWDEDTEDVKWREIMCMAMLFCGNVWRVWFLRLCWWSECVLSRVRQHFLLGQAWIQGTSVTCGSFPQHDLQSSLKKSAHAHFIGHSPANNMPFFFFFFFFRLKHLVFGGFLKACRLLLPCVNKQLKYLSKHTSVSHQPSLHSKETLINQFSIISPKSN